MRLVGHVLVVVALSAAWWVMTRSPLVFLVTLAVGTMRVVQERHSPRLSLDSLILSGVVVAVGYLYLERVR